MTKKNKILVVIPYYAKEAQGCELSLAIQGWKRHFREPHEIVVVGDYHPAVLRDDVTFVPCRRIKERWDQYTPHLDHMNKFHAAHKCYPSATGFIYACDDMYAVKDFTLADVQRPKVADLQIPPVDWREEKGWWRDAGKTREYCLISGWPVNNWVCHLPVWFDFDKLFSLEMRDESFVWENLYYNKYFPSTEFERVSERCRWKYEVKTSNPGIRSAEGAHAVWITNANSGWSQTLEAILKKHYGL